MVPGQSFSRGDGKKIHRKILEKDVRILKFPDRAIDQWNMLPEVIACVKKYPQFQNEV